MASSSTSSIKDKWLIDSGCTSHMTNDSSIFKKVDSSIKVPVRMGNGAVVKSTRKGTIIVQTKKGTKYINDVLLLPDLNESLLSVAQMVRNGYSLVLENNHCIFMDPEKKEIANVFMENKSFALKWDSAVEGAHATHSSDTWLWHKRYGHFNMCALCELQKKNMVRYFPSISLNNDLCEPCKLGKQHRLPFPKEKVWKASEKLQLVHTDICEPHRTLSLGGKKYFILFIDDFTRMTWVYFMKEKSEVFKVFKKFKALAEVQSGCKLQKLISDRGKEYTSTEFDLFYEDEGIEHQLTVGYTPQQNGVSERKNRTIMEMARCMLMEKNLSKKFWAVANYALVSNLNDAMSGEPSNEDHESEEANNENQTPSFTPIQPNDDSGESSNSQNATCPRGKKSLLDLYN
ncbi:hypothetical protein GQ457_04G018680 [Hibiscus cannabinus]